MSAPAPTPEKSEQQITTWLLDYLARVTGLPPGEVAADTTFDALGIDSYQGVLMAHELEVWLARRVDMAESFLFPTPRLFAVHLAGQIRTEASASA